MRNMALSTSLSFMLVSDERKCILLEKSNSHYTHTYTFW